jgi:hypothetical protein
MTVKPSPESCLQVSNPIPRLAPVTKAIFLLLVGLLFSVITSYIVLGNIKNHMIYCQFLENVT